MDIKDIYYLVAGIAIIMGAAFWIRDSIGKLWGSINLLKQDLNNHKEVHNKLENRMQSNEKYLEEKLEKFEGKIDELKNLLIKRLE